MDKGFHVCPKWPLLLQIVFSLPVLVTPDVAEAVG